MPCCVSPSVWEPERGIGPLRDPARRSLVRAVLVLGVAGCTGPKQLAKTDVDRVADAHRRAVGASLRRVAEKLYRRNPREWRKAGQPGLEAALARFDAAAPAWTLPEPERRRGAEAIHLALREDFRGDRVFAYCVGLGGMAASAFNDRDEFFVLDDLDPQKLYNCARNLEIAAWKLANARGTDGELLLLSNDGGATPNLSFEREFGRMIGNLDLLAQIVADKTSRVVARVVQNLATAVFLPL